MPGKLGTRPAGTERCRALLRAAVPAAQALPAHQRPRRVQRMAVEADEPHIALAKQANTALKSALLGAGLRSPFL